MFACPLGGCGRQFESTWSLGLHLMWDECHHPSLLEPQQAQINDSSTEAKGNRHAKPTSLEEEEEEEDTKDSALASRAMREMGSTPFCEGSPLLLPPPAATLPPDNTLGNAKDDEAEEGQTSSSSTKKPQRSIVCSVKGCGQRFDTQLGLDFHMRFDTHRQQQRRRRPQNGGDTLVIDTSRVHGSEAAASGQSSARPGAEGEVPGLDDEHDASELNVDSESKVTSACGDSSGSYHDSGHELVTESDTTESFVDSDAPSPNVESEAEEFNAGNLGSESSTDISDTESSIASDATGSDESYVEPPAKNRESELRRGRVVRATRSQTCSLSVIPAASDDGFVKGPVDNCSVRGNPI
ncbi:hypothetical protein BGZ73_007837 [Actinomortierella ambigua]|nr:hypothetical protein BGZ73_007837 [Actinomortierella ambigua]